MKKLSSKIMSGLMASFMGLSPIMSTQVSAMFDRIDASQNQVKPIEDCSKEELLQRLPSLWRRFFATQDAVMEDSYYNVYHNACDVVWNAVGGIVTNVVWSFANNVAKCEARRAYIASKDDTIFLDAEPPVRNRTVDFNYDAIYDASYDVAFFNAWKHEGAAYNIIKDYDTEYSRNLVRILEEKVNNLERMAQQLRR